MLIALMQMRETTKLQTLGLYEDPGFAELAFARDDLENKRNYLARTCG